MAKEIGSFGKFLQAVRIQHGLTLRAVEKVIGVSNAYLSQLEHDQIKQPSPIILYKLSNFYKISYAELMSIAGYPYPLSDQAADTYNVSSRIGPLTEEEEEALIKYLGDLRSSTSKNHHK